MLPDLVVTDFAGTTLADGGAVLGAYRHALLQHQIPFSEADLASQRGANKRAVFRSLVSKVRSDSDADTLAEAAHACFEAALRREYESGDVREVPGAEAALRELKAAGVKIALGSGFERGLVELLLRRLGWQALFDHVTSSDDVARGRPAPYMIYRPMMELGVTDVGRVAVVGDTVLDLQAGANARAGWVIGVLSGAHDLDSLGSTAHTHLLPSVACLPTLFGLTASVAP